MAATIGDGVPSAKRSGSKVALGKLLGSRMAVLASLIERLGWWRATALCMAALMPTALVMAILIDAVLEVPVNTLRVHLASISAITLLLAAPCLAIAFRLVTHLAHTRERLLVEIDRRLLAEQQLRRLATTDDLTGLHNRRHFVERARASLTIARRYGQDCALAIIDIDRFKSLNDRLGHQAGDQALRVLATALRANLRASDLAARFGGDEFVVLMPLTDAAAAQQGAERLRGAIRAAGDGLTVSIGVAAVRGDEASYEELMARADLALYEAKRLGRDQVRVHAAATLPSSRFLVAG